MEKKSKDKYGFSTITYLTDSYRALGKAKAMNPEITEFCDEMMTRIDALRNQFRVISPKGVSAEAKAQKAQERAEAKSARDKEKAERASKKASDRLANAKAKKVGKSIETAISEVSTPEMATV